MTDIVTAITGASGAMYAQRFIQGLVAGGVNVHLIVSPLGRRLFATMKMGLENNRSANARGHGRP